MPETTQSRIIIKDIELVSEMREVEELQKEVWGCDDREIVSALMLIPTKEVGAVLVGAFDDKTLVGFAYGFIGYEQGRVMLHSDMLAVKRAYRNFNLGYKLKLAQRERAIALGLELMTWTFDPLQALNAHFNFGKLGVIADRYKINFYGEQTSSFLHRNIGTDRLWVSWLLKSRRVRQRLEKESPAEHSVSELEGATPLVQVEKHNSPMIVLTEKLMGENATIEIPGDIGALQEQNPGLAFEWREATRRAFTEALASGYLVEEFYRLHRNDQWLGVYLLRSGKKITDFIE